ncbi:TetR/AcrR family transcriptional regulator [Cumulibacter soli]|uniref:TetR/AcrR family transcriptional regulator n=1 Tax=Cumulibacter soli TaxID=2546344 RepID=UPI001067FEF2|nr:TetR/AcrR family transcriptional regulator [Cumulibacter soli]
MTDSARQPIPRTPRSEVRARLIASASRAFAEEGYVAARIDEIAYAAGFTKGAIYSNFGSKQGLFAAVLQARADDELHRLLEATTGKLDVAETVGEIIAEEVTTDTERGRLSLEFAARAAHDDDVSIAWTAMRRQQRAIAEQAIIEVVERNGLTLTVEPADATLILHCITNGLSMEHLADPDRVDSNAIRKAVAATVRSITTRDTSP